MSQRTEAARLKLELLCWLRYGRRMPIVCTEFAHSAWIADVFGINEGLSIEIEVKVDRYDLRREFSDQGKLVKHIRYQVTPIPNVFYLGVTPALAEEAIQLVQQHAPKYGVVVVNDTQLGYGRNSEVRRKAQKLHDKPPPFRLTHAAIQRMSSELVHLHQLQEVFAAQVTDMVRDAKDKVVKLASRSSAVVDVDDEGAMHARAAELAYCVDGISLEEFEELDVEKRERWFEAAKRYNEAAFVTGSPAGLGNWI